MKYINQVSTRIGSYHVATNVSNHILPVSFENFDWTW